MLFRADVYSENGVGSTTKLIELSRSNIPALISLLHVAHDLLEVDHFFLRQLVDVDALSNTLSDIQIFVTWLDEIINMLVINFNV